MNPTPSLQQAKTRIKQLRKEIICHEKKYYRDNKPQISDFEFDSLMFELQKIEEKFPELTTPESPTQRVGEQSRKGFDSIKHSIPMLSLDNCYNSTELKKFEERIQKSLLSQKIEYVTELKIDGLGISIIYQDGKFTRAVTRGDGIRGEDVTANVKTIKSLPLTIPEKHDIEVRGEIYLPFHSFQKINQTRSEKNESLFANPRNAAAGSIRLLDPKIVAARSLDVFLYSVYIEEQEQESQWDNLKKLKALGFKTNPHSRLNSSLEEVIMVYEGWQKSRENFDYDIDGIVIKVNEVEQQKILGQTSKFPRWAISLKFTARQATTKINDIVIQVGRTGALTPVALLEPVKLSGITISRATLHNEEEIKRKEIRKGDIVLIERSGDVIPRIVSVMKEKRTGQEKIFTLPTLCPVCQTKIFKPKGDAVSRCINPSSPAIMRQSLLHFASRRAMNIEGLGNALVDQMIKEKLVTEIPDLYSLKLKDLDKLERMGRISSLNLLDEIKKSKNQSLIRVIFALGIRYVGERTARILASHYKNMKKLTEAKPDELLAIKDIGPKVSEGIVYFFKQPENIKLIQKLEAAGLNFSSLESSTRKDPYLGDKLFVLTGTLSSMTREQAKEKIENLGGIVTSSLSRKTIYLVVGSASGSKLQKAQKLGIMTLSEREFLDLIKEK